jgi:hypothetical protein
MSFLPGNPYATKAIYVLTTGGTLEKVYSERTGLVINLDNKIDRKRTVLAGHTVTLIQQLAEEQEAEQVEDEKLVVAVEEAGTEAEVEDERTAEEVPAEYEEIET